jgi:hypothetical protein
MKGIAKSIQHAYCNKLQKLADIKLCNDKWSTYPKDKGKRVAEAR